MHPLAIPTREKKKQSSVANTHMATFGSDLCAKLQVAPCPKVANPVPIDLSILVESVNFLGLIFTSLCYRLKSCFLADVGANRLFVCSQIKRTFCCISESNITTSSSKCSISSTVCRPGHAQLSEVFEAIYMVMKWQFSIFFSG